MSRINELKELTKDVKVLYVEDEENVREQTKMMFEIFFNRVDVASDGEEGLKKYENEDYDIIFTDISMPKIDGLKLTEIIKSKNPHQRIIIISAYNTNDYLLKAIGLGVDGFLLKPINIDNFILTIRKVVESILVQKFIKNYHKTLEEEVKRKTEIIKKQLTIDNLTGLENRYSFEQYINSTKENKSLILINIDNFESINTIYGYENGNKVIKTIGNRLKDYNKIFYLGADEFAILVYESNDEKLYEFAKNLQKNISAPVEIEDFNIEITLTVAIAKGDDLLKKAHIALKEAKKEGKNKIKFYTSNLTLEKLQEKIQHFTPILKNSIKRKNIVPFFQGILNTKTLKVEKFECLARIICNNNKLYSPHQFIDVATLTGFLPEITKIMIEKSFAVFKNNNYEFSLNITEVDLNEGYLIEFFDKKIKKYNISPSRVILEVLEGISVKGMESSLKQLKELKKRGFKIAIDDFGTQHSNFERVNAMNVDFIKIDGIFVKNINKDEKSFSIVKTINDFAKSIGAKTVAEFVYNKEVFKKIKELGVDYAQGYYFHKPTKDIKPMLI